MSNEPLIESFDPKRLSISNRSITAPDPAAPPTHRAGQTFLKGPIPWNWLCRAAKLPGKALHVAIALWFKAGLTNEAKVSVAHKILDTLGVDRKATNRQLDSMERAGLVRIDRKPGRSPRVTLLACPDEQEIAKKEQDDVK